MRENDLLRWIAATVPGHGAVPIGVGDDMAAVRLAGELALLKIDQCLDGVHFKLREHGPRAAGAKAIRRCLSDCAAMACLPAGALVAVALPREADEELARELLMGCRAAAEALDCPLVGGDTALWDQRLAITVAALGKMPDGRAPVRRSGAKAGDALIVSGELGGSILGRHLTFEPRIRLADALARAVPLHAMMDLSDGLAMDLPRLCEASGVGAEVAASHVPAHADAEALWARDGLPAGLHALIDGEDYELLFAVAEDALPILFPRPGAAPFGVKLTRIGTVTAERNVVLLDADDQRHPWPKGGWEHRSDA